MFVEGIRIYLVTIDVVAYHSQNARKRMKIFMVVGYLTPALLVSVGLAAGLSTDTYMKPQPFYTYCNRYRNISHQIQKFDRCWISPKSPVFYATVVAPLAIILILNFGVAIQTSLVMLNSKRQSKRNQGHSYKNVTKAAKSLVLLFLMLGGSWVLAFFTGECIYFSLSATCFGSVNPIVPNSNS